MYSVMVYMRMLEWRQKGPETDEAKIAKAMTEAQIGIYTYITTRSCLTPYYRSFTLI